MQNSTRGPLVELTVPMRTLRAGIGDRVHVSGDLARYLCVNGLAVMVDVLRGSVVPTRTAPCR